jgi:rod shape-determining protein MreD
MASRTSPAFWVFILILVIVHFALHVAVGLGTGAPDLLTVALLLSARRLNGAVAAALGLALGIIADALSLTAFGALAVVYTVLGFVGARSRDLFEGDSLLFVGVFIFIGKWLRDALYLLLTHSALGDPWGSLLTNAPLAGLYAAFSAMIALTLYRAATGER